MLESFIVGALATYGLAYSVKSLDGPFGLFDTLRMWGDKRGGWIQHGLYCEICLSFWIGMVIAPLVVGLHPLAVAHWLGYVGFAVFANVVLNRIRGK